MRRHLFEASSKETQIAIDHVDVIKFGHGFGGCRSNHLLSLLLNRQAH